MGRLRLITLIVSLLFIALPGQSYGQASSAFSSSIIANNGQASSQIRQLTTSAVSNIRYLTLHQADLATAASQIYEGRTKTIAAITDIVNNYKAANERYLAAGDDRRLDPAMQDRVRVSITQLELAAQQAVNEIDIATTQSTTPPLQSPSLPLSSRFPFLRTNLPASYGPTVFGSLPQPLPPATALYARNGSPVFVPNSIAQGYAYYPVPDPEVARRQNNNNFLYNIGYLLGHYINTNGFGFSRNAAIKISKAYPHDQKQYYITLAGNQTVYQHQAVPDWTQSPLKRTIEPGRYNVYYTDADEDKKDQPLRQSTYYPVTINARETWCFRLPEAPVRCE